MAAEITQWVDPTGATTLLDVDWKASGRFMPKVKHQSFPVPGQSGAKRQRSLHDTHDFTIRVVLTANTEAALRDQQRDLVSVFNPLNGEGTLRVTSPIGDVREIVCIYSDGLGMDESPGMSGIGTQFADITLTAFDPYWRDPSDISVPFTIGAGPTFFPIFPLTLTTSAIAASGAVSNGGDVEAWPVWTIVGPGSAVVLQNLSTGESMTLPNTALDTGDQLTIDTEAGTVLLGDGTNKFSDLDVSTSVLWSLRPGSSTVQLQMSGAIAGTSSLTMSYRQKYLSP